jgi:hypothetical protein
MRSLSVSLIASFLLSAPAFAGTTVLPTTTLTNETSSNTSTASTFAAQSNGNEGLSNISKVDTRTLLYSGTNTKIYAHFMGWFGPSNHMQVGYTSSDTGQVDKQIADARSRGISGFILDWYGQNNSMPNATAFTLKSEAERNGAFQFAIMEDGGALGTCNSTPGCDVTGQLIIDLQYAYSNFEQSPAYITFNGRPAVFFFDPDRYGTLDWQRVATTMSAYGNPLLIFENSGGFTHAQSSGSISWVIIDTTNANDWEQSYLDNFYQTALSYSSEHAFGATYKGFNDTLASWGSKRIMNQNCGQTWLSTFSEIGKYYGGSAPQLESLQLVTWNDYEEGTEIESGIDNCVGLTASVAGTQLSWTISGNENTIDHYTPFISTDGENLMPLSDVPAGVHSVDLSTYGFATGTYAVYVKAVGKPTLKNQMSNAASFVNGPAPDFTMSISPSAASVRRGGIVSYTVSLAAVNGFTGNVSLGVTGLPSRSSASFNPSSLSGSGSSTLTITTSKKSTSSTYNLTVTAKSGTLSHSKTATLTVQ